MNTENYYILLDLDPSIQDADIIGKAITAKINEWSRDRNNPSKSTQAKVNLKLANTMRSELGDKNGPELWNTQAEEARKILAQRQKQKFQELDESLKLYLVSKNFLWKKELAYLIKTSGFTEEEIKVRAKVPIREDLSESTESAAPMIDASIMRGIENELNVVKKKDLYEFLELSPTSSVELLIQKAKEKDRDLKSKSDKGGEATASGTLVGHCIKLFETEEKRKSYDRSLQKIRLEKINKRIDQAGHDEKISSEEFDMLIVAGTREGIDKVAVAEYIRQYVKKKRWELEVARDSRINEMLDCGICGTLNEPIAKTCTSCGLAMSLKCPGCGHENRNTVQACAKCAYKVGDMSNAMPLIRNAREAFAIGDWNATEIFLNQAELFWKGHTDITAVRQQISAARAETDIQVTTVRDLIQKNLYYKAQSELDKLPTYLTTAGQIKIFADRIQRTIQDAEAALSTANGAKTNKEKETWYLKALSICADCEEADNGLAKIPPETVQGLTSRAEGRLVLITWSGISSTESVSYKIIRKNNASPTHHNDGDILGETTQTEFQDPSGDTGTTYYYGVFTKRRGTFSPVGALSPPLVKTADVERLEAIPGNSRIALRWNTPINVNRVEVWFSTNGKPPRRGEGQMLSSGQMAGANHENLVNDASYGYLVVSVFKDIFGKEYFSSGAQVVMAPSAPPEAVSHLETEYNNGVIELSWQNPGSGKTDIYCMNLPYSYKIGEAIPIEDLSKCGRLVPISQPGKASFRPQQHGIYYFLSVTSKGSLCIAGHSRYVAHLEEISNLKGGYSDGLLRLEWEFPSGAKKVRLNYQNTQLDVSEADYNRDRAFFIQSLDSTLWELNLSIRTLIDTPDGTKLSNGVVKQIRLRKTTVQFSVHKKVSSWFSKSLKFEFRMTATGVVPCPLYLVVKENNKLISYKDMDRTQLAEINPGIQMNNYGGEVEYSPSGKNVKILFFSLVPQDPNAKDELQIEDNGKKINL